MAELTPLVEAWIRYPEDDWQDSQILAGAGGNSRSICFHAQQCIEELFKAVDLRYPDPGEPEPQMDQAQVLAGALELRKELLRRVLNTDDQEVR